jgi:hypothetical protein
MSEWACTLPGVVTTVGVAREGQLIGCVCGLQVRPQHLQSCSLACFDSNVVREQYRRLQMLHRAAIAADNGLAEHLDPSDFQAPPSLSAGFLATIRAELKREAGTKKGSKNKAQARAAKWVKSEERRQLGGMMTHWSYVERAKTTVRRCRGDRTGGMRFPGSPPDRSRGGRHTCP